MKNQPIRPVLQHIYNIRNDAWPRGFSLIELLVVLAIIGVLSGLAATSMSRNTAYFENIAQADVMALQMALQAVRNPNDNAWINQNLAVAAEAGRRTPLNSLFPATSPSASPGNSEYNLSVIQNSVGGHGINCAGAGAWEWAAVAVPIPQNNFNNVLYYFDTGRGFTDTNGNRNCADAGEVW